MSITYGGASPALVVTDSGSNKAIESFITNSANPTSAVYGQTNGAGAGITGYNIGFAGPAGKFAITNPQSDQPAITATTVGGGPGIVSSVSAGAGTAIGGYNMGVGGSAGNFELTNPAANQSALTATTAGLGSAIVGTISTTSKSYSSGVVGVSNALEGTGVSGIGESYISTGVYGGSESGLGLMAESGSGTALYALSDDGPYAIEANNNNGTGLYAYTDTGTGVFVYAETTGVGISVSTYQGDGIDVKSLNSPAIFAQSDSNYAIVGQSTDWAGVMGNDLGSGYGIYGSSVSGYAGYFDGKVAAKSFVTLSDRDAKTHLKPVDGKEFLERVGRLPISSWDFKGDSQTHHVGPMAQDFHAAFGLGGNDDTHINLADIAGVSLVAIQELNARLQVKDAQIAELSAQLAALSARVNSMERR